MKQNDLHRFFSTLNKSDIRYLLLRPLNLNRPLTDVDLVVHKGDFNSFLLLLENNFEKLMFKNTAYNETLRIYADQLILDIQFQLAFLPRKSFLSPAEIPFAPVIFKKDKNTFMPDVKPEILFTLWVLRLFLDKKRVSDSGSFLTFKELYSDKWEALFSSVYFKNFVAELFRNKMDEALALIAEFFRSGFDDNEGNTNSDLKSLLFQAQPKVNIKYLYDQLKFRILRVLGRFDKKYPLERLKSKMKS